MKSSPPAPPAPPGVDGAPAAPASPLQLFTAFTQLALQGFGGVIAIVQRELVERRRWLTREQFLEDWAVVQILPGPNVMNLALMLGDRHFGLRGAIAAYAGMVMAPLAIVVALALFYNRFSDVAAVGGALRGMGAVAAGLIVATGLRLAVALRQHPLGWPACLCFSLTCFVAVGLLRWPLFFVLAGLGCVSCVLTWRRLAP